MADPCLCAVCQNAAGNLVGNLFSGILTLISKPIILVIKCDNNVDYLKNKVAELKDERETVENYAGAVERSGEQIAQKVRNWQTKANNCIEAAEKLVADAEGNAKKKWFFGQCLNPKSRHQFSKKAEENSKTIGELVIEARGFNLPLSHTPAPPKEVPPRVKGFEDFSSREDVLGRIMKALQSQSSSIIGVHGMPGVGKTMLAKEVKRKAEQDKLFDVVVMALVPKNAKSKKIQVQIARGLGLDQLPDGIATQDVAKLIKDRLKNMKKVLMILDDIWESGIDLEDLGIPLRNEPKKIEESSSREEHVECKILLTSRDSNVLSDLMGSSQQNFSLDTLEFEEAWDLLKKIVGDRAESDDIRSTAFDIVQECGGLPLAITTMAKALKNKKPCEWRDALRKLRKPSSENFHGISAKVYSAIEVSYSHLESKKLQETFLLCCLMGHKASIQDLWKYGVGLGLFANTVVEALDEVHTLISTLRASSLLIDDSDDNRFDMHDLAQDVAVSIASGTLHGLLLTGDHAPREWLDMEAMKDFKWIWLEKANINELPDEFDTPQLTFFCLNNKDPSLKIPADFFKGMQRLKVLDLTKMHLPSLPSSISLLKNLHTFCLYWSVLGDIGIIGELKNLESLNLSGSDFEELPREIGQLTRLKLLDLCHCTKLQIIPPGVFANMSRLEALYLGNSFGEWEVEENENQRNASIAELKHLKKLTILEVCIPDIRMVPKDLFFENLKRFKIFIGRKWNGWYDSFGSSRILKLHLNASISFNHSIKMLLKKTEDLHLRELAGVKKVVDELNTEGFPDLKNLYVRNAPEVQHIIKSAEGVPFNVFPRLEELFLQNLINLEKIFQGRFKDTAFNHLRTVTIECCDKVKNLFSSSIARQLLHLQEISVINCSNMEEIVDDEEQGSRNDIVEATELKFGEALRSLRLRHLPKLRSLNKSSRHMPLFSEQVAFPNLEELELSWINVNIMWHASTTSPHAAKLTKLIIEGCGNWKYLFPSYIALGLTQLKDLKVANCAAMEQVTTGEGAEELFPKLKSIILEYCPNLKCFYEGSSGLEFLRLHKITVVNCPCLATFASSFSSDRKKEITTNDTESEERPVIPPQPFFSEKVAFPNLEELELSWINVNTIWHASITSSHVAKLTKLIIEGCGKLEYLFPSSTTLGLVQLYSLKVTNCAKMERVISGEGARELFPKLFTIFLDSCPNLKCFYEASSRLEFPRLYEITVVNCPALAAFASSFSSDQKKEIKTNDTESEERLVIVTQPFFSDKVVLPNLQELQLCWMNVNIKWHTSITYLCLEKLKKLIIQGCDNLEYLFSSSIARGLVMLSQVEIRECKRMREIIVTENAEEKENLIFPQLNFLLLKDLQNIVGFYSGNCIVEFPSLKQLQVLNCPELEGFIVKYFTSTNVTTDKQPFFNEQVAFPNLECLALTHLKNLDIIWHNQFHAESFGKLQSLIVKNCEKLSTIFPSVDMLGRIWKSLEKLILSWCGSLEVVFGIAEFNAKQRHATIDTKLRELNIDHLPRLRYVWNKDPQGILTFHNLESVDIRVCDRLKILFPASIGKSLAQLQKLHLFRCGVEEIVTIGEQGNEAIVNFEFPRVSSLRLERLPRLQCFHPRKHTTAWPKLKEFYFSPFNQVKRTDGSWQLDFPMQLPLFSIEKVIPQLEELSLSRYDIAVICEHPFKKDLFSNVKVLTIRDYLDNELDVLPIRFLQRFCHVEGLVVLSCNIKELYPSKGEVEEQEKHIEIETLSRIKTLNLISLPYLRRIWSRDSSIVLQNLETLQVFWCESLVNLSTSPAFFQNLVALNIGRCEAMVNLVSISVVQSLVQLKRMTVSWCHMLTEIVENEGNGMQDLIMITLTKLRFLKLESLPRLESFCSGNFSFNFPSLEKLIVIQCPKLMIFNEGNVNTPLLQRVELIEGENNWRWEGDLNATIRRMSMEEVQFAGFEYLILSNFPKLLETWHFKNPKELLDFRQLQVLEICNCSKFRYLLTHSMALGLVKLLQLIVKNCGTMEEVIMGEGAKNKMEFPHLWLINLESCSDLTSFYVGSHTLEFPNLYHFIVKDCPKMITFVGSTSSKEHSKEESQYLFSSKVEAPNLDFLNLSSNNIQRILDNSILEISSYVQNLRKLCVEGCGNLEYLLTSSMVKSFEQLNWLKICDCNMMEEVILAEESMDEERMCKIFFPKLEFLLLQDLPKLTRFCSGNYLELPCLWKLKISKCPVLKTFISSLFFGDIIASSEDVKNTCTLSLFDAKVAFPKLERLIIEHVKSLTKIWNNQLEEDSFCQLTLVSVVSCEKLLNIFPFGMLERLQRVDKLQIWNCDSLEEILESHEPGVSQSQAQKASPLPLLETVTCLEDDVKDEIVFSKLKLKYLQLCGLPRLSSFCSVKCKFEFPFLEEVILMDCPSMQTFSMDEIRTPKLQKVKLTRDEDEGFWDSNLNSTVQLQFMQKSQGDSEN